MEVNKKLRKYLEDNGIKQSFLEEKTGLSHDKISKILNCKRRISIEEIISISTVLKVDVNIFLN